MIIIIICGYAGFGDGHWEKKKSLFQYGVSFQRKVFKFKTSNKNKHPFLIIGIEFIFLVICSGLLYDINPPPLFLGLYIQTKGFYSFMDDMQRFFYCIFASSLFACILAKFR